VELGHQNNYESSFIDTTKDKDYFESNVQWGDEFGHNLGSQTLYLSY
jgi:hypothetical protein